MIEWRPIEKGAKLVGPCGCVVSNTSEGAKLAVRHRHPGAVHFAPYGRPATVCGMPKLRNGMAVTQQWRLTTCLVCLAENPNLKEN